MCVCPGVSEEPDRSRERGHGTPMGSGRKVLFPVAFIMCSLSASKQRSGRPGSPPRENRDILAVPAPPSIYLERACFLFPGARFLFPVWARPAPAATRNLPVALPCG